MTPKEKARSIYNKYLETQPSSDLYHIRRNSLLAIEIIIEDLLNSLEVANEVSPHAVGLVAGSLKHWIEVQKELKSL